MATYSVGVGRSTYMDGTPAPDEECGHKHRTSDAAERCQSRLLGYHREHGGWVCSARWYNSYIVEHLSASEREARREASEAERAAEDAWARRAILRDYAMHYIEAVSGGHGRRWAAQWLEGLYSPDSEPAREAVAQAWKELDSRAIDCVRERIAANRIARAMARGEVR